MIAFNLTTPLVSLVGFCDLTKVRTRSQSVPIQLDAIKEAAEYIKDKKDFLRDKITAENDPDFTSELAAANYLRDFATELQTYEKAIAKSLDALLIQGFETGDPSLEKWSVNTSTNALENLHKILDALRNIQPNLELTIEDG